MLKRALISVYDKTGIVEFARELNKLGIEIISTGGTAILLKKYGIPVKTVSDVTKFPEILDGRVKTLHPMISGGILAVRDKKEHMEELKKHDIKPIDIVICNLYPFEEVTSKDNVDLDEALENIDVGGPNMIRAAAKNFENVVVIVDPSRYDQILQELEKNGDVSKETRADLAVEAFKCTAKYDWIIYDFLGKQKTLEKFPDVLNLTYKKIKDLRYGENPHQKAALYRNLALNKKSLIDAEQITGKELSWNNFLDINTSLMLAKEFDEPTAVIVKHATPCGVACDSNIFNAYEKAYSADPVSAFGGIVSINRKVDLELAKSMSSAHFDCIIAPDFDEIGIKLLRQRKSLILLKTGPFSQVIENDMDIVKISGGLLVQEHDNAKLKDLKVVTKVKPTQEQLNSLIFAWKVVKYVRSNGIVLVKDKKTVGIGAGQTSRVDSAKIAIMKAKNDARSSLMASDGFIPFRDVIDEAAKAGIAAIIQPGGSINDEKIIDAANEYKIPMVFTGLRCFRH
jgi:phosphoribosylaminoimidazolecarboxamide formyltransferase/IMP cyclohydrolase